MPWQEELKAWLTLALTINVSRSDYLEPLFIGQLKALFVFKSGLLLNLAYNTSSTKRHGWTLLFFNHEILIFNVMVIKSFFSLTILKAICLMSCNLTHIWLEYFRPNLIMHNQPCDAGTILTFKVVYHFCLFYMFWHTYCW